VPAEPNQRNKQKNKPRKLLKKLLKNNTNILPTVLNILLVSIRKEENIPQILPAEVRDQIKLDIQACAEKKIEAQAFSFD
jgi:hypothetical protein